MATTVMVVYHTERESCGLCSQKKQNNVYYEVTPVYNGNELVPRYVIVNAKSEAAHENEPRLAVPSCHGEDI